ncbi:MAG: hypothetical protein IKD69_07055 [Solobacterium sp.]|nr:hypothetical protein [Solobacterium sp.]
MEEGGTAPSRYERHTDGTPCEVKVSCTVWVRGKSGDDFKGLPIDIVVNGVSSVQLINLAEGKLTALTMMNYEAVVETAMKQIDQILKGISAETFTETEYLIVSSDNVQEVFDRSTEIWQMDPR